MKHSDHARPACSFISVVWFCASVFYALCSSGNVLEVDLVVKDLHVGNGTDG